MRTYEELYKLVLDYYQKDYPSFICNIVSRLHTYDLITEKEATKLYGHLHKNRPSKKKYRKYLGYESGNCFWSCEDNKREEFIKHLIKKYETARISKKRSREHKTLRNK